jgi:hypothetical protein
MSMPRQNRRLASIQLDLFHTMEARPLEWRRLSAEVREQVTRLLAQMLSDRQARQHPDHGDGGPAHE